jgi:hypothetical protein
MRITLRAKDAGDAQRIVNEVAQILEGAQKMEGPPPIPTRFKAACEFCGYDLDTRKEGVHQWTAGWVMQREGGGGHGISLAKRENRWAHRHCVDRASRGFAHQERMF